MGRLLHYISLLCCVFVIISFALFAHGQVSHASTQQANAVASTQTVATTSGPHKTGQPRRFIDGVAHKLDSPFTGIVSSDDAWVTHGIPTLFALLVYGLGLGFLVRWASGRAQ
jgi:hypothetical protein